MAESYWNEKIAGNPDGTLRAKKTDLELFLSFFGEVVGSDHVDYWTPSVSKSFRSWLEQPNPRKPKRRYKKGYAPASINRTLDTLRHFRTHVVESREFEAGNPMAGVKDLETPQPEPEWKGLEDIELMGLRAFELEGLDFEQYKGKYSKRVKGKGHSCADIYLSADARSELDAYLAEERCEEDGSLFLANRDGRLSRQQIDRFMRSVANHATSKLSPENQIQLHTYVTSHIHQACLREERGHLLPKNMVVTKALFA